MSNNDTDSVQVVFFDLGDTLVEPDPTSPGRFRWAPGAKETLLELAQIGLRRGLISNTGNLDREDLSAMLPADFEWSLFDAHLVILSSEVGIEKPDLRIFRLGLTRAREQEEAEETGDTDGPTCLFCGENLAETLAAQRVGMRAARISSGGRHDIGLLVDRLREVDLLH